LRAPSRTAALSFGLLRSRTSSVCRPYRPRPVERTTGQQLLRHRVDESAHLRIDIAPQSEAFVVFRIYPNLFGFTLISMV
jgi:hypothetical protein